MSLSGFSEPNPDLVIPNPGGEFDPLGESILNHDWAPLRIFEPDRLRIVIGRHQKVQREVLCANAREDEVPIHRRLSGGGAVVLAPGMLVIATRIPMTAPGGDSCLCHVAHAVCEAIKHCNGPDAQVRGHGDVAIPHEDGSWRKVLGASLRQRRGYVYYLGVLMVDHAVPHMERYLAPPSRQPDYRADRDHGAFCDHLGRHGLHISPLASACEAYIAKTCGGDEVPNLNCSSQP